MFNCIKIHKEAQVQFQTELVQIYCLKFAGPVTGQRANYSKFTFLKRKSQFSTHLFSPFALICHRDVLKIKSSFFKSVKKKPPGLTQEQ